MTLAESNISGLVTDLAAKVGTSAQVSAGSGLTGGGSIGTGTGVSISASFGTNTSITVSAGPGSAGTDTHVQRAGAVPGLTASNPQQGQVFFAHSTTTGTNTVTDGAWGNAPWATSTGTGLGTSTQGAILYNGSTATGTNSTSSPVWGAPPPIVSTATPLIDGTGAVGTSLKYSREDHVHPQLTGYRLISYTRYTTDGTLTLNSLTTVACLSGCAAGGGGGGAFESNGSWAAVAGGGAQGAGFYHCLSVVGGYTMTLSVGSSTLGGNTGGTDGSDGSNASVYYNSGYIITAAGGKGGKGCNNCGCTSYGCSWRVAGGLSPNTSVGSGVKFQPGTHGATGKIVFNGACNIDLESGFGGGQGGGQALTSAASCAPGDGNAGTGFCSGGSGAVSCGSSGGVGHAGGTGAAGIVELWQYGNGAN
jgi:hypothetical protein